MAAITDPQYIDRVERLGQQNGIILSRSDIQSSLPLACAALARQIAASPGYAGFQKTFTLTMANGVADLSASSSMLKDTIRRVVHPDPFGDGSETNVAFSRLPNHADETDLDSPSLVPLFRYVSTRDSLVARHWDGDTLPTDTAALVVTANYVPTLSEVTDDDDIASLVQIGFEISRQMSGEVAA